MALDARAGCGVRCGVGCLVVRAGIWYRHLAGENALWYPVDTQPESFAAPHSRKGPAVAHRAQPPPRHPRERTVAHVRARLSLSAFVTKKL